MPSPDSDEDEELGTYQRKLRGDDSWLAYSNSLIKLPLLGDCKGVKLHTPCIINLYAARHIIELRSLTTVAVQQVSQIKLSCS